MNLAEPEVGRGAVTRDDVAGVIALLLVAPGVWRLATEFVGSQAPIAGAVVGQV